jgi:hypothetical protein
MCGKWLGDRGLCTEEGHRGMHQEEGSERDTYHFRRCVSPKKLETTRKFKLFLGWLSILIRKRLAIYLPSMSIAFVFLI